MELGGTIWDLPRFSFLHAAPATPGDGGGLPVNFDLNPSAFTYMTRGSASPFPTLGGKTFTALRLGSLTYGL